MYESLTNSRLFSLFLKGDNKAFEIFYDRMYHPGVSVALRIVKEEPKAEDVVQNTGLKFLSSRKKLKERFRGDKVEGYFIVSVRRLALNVVRYEKHSKNYVSIDEMFSLGEDCEEGIVRLIDNEVYRKILDSAMEGLSEQHRVTLDLWYRSGLGTVEIANQLGIKEGTVYSRLNRAKARLRTELEIRNLDYLLLDS